MCYKVGVKLGCGHRQVALHKAHKYAWQSIPHSWSTDREAAVTVTCPRPWDDELARVCRS